MGVDYPFQMTEAEACARLQRLGAFFHNRHGMHVAWNGPRHATFQGTYLTATVSGVLVIQQGVASFRGVDPGALWRKKATDYITSKLQAYLNPAVALTDLPIN